MRYSVEEFYKFTPAKLKEISDIYKEEKKNVIIRAYIDIMKAQHGDDKKEKIKDSTTRIVKDANEFFDLI